MSENILYGEVFLIAQIIALLLFMPAYCYMILVYRYEKKWKFFTIAFGWLLLSTLAAIIREFYAFATFRMLEWIFITIASLLFAYACYHHYTRLSIKFKSGGYGITREERV